MQSQRHVHGSVNRSPMTDWSIPERKSFPVKESSPSVRVYLCKIDGPLLEFS